MSAYGEYRHGLIDGVELRDRVRQEEYPEYEEETVQGNCERCAWYCKGKCRYDEIGCGFEDINEGEE